MLMNRETRIKLRVGDWCIHPASGEISRSGESARLEVRAMRLLLYLAEHADQVVSIDELLDHVWSGVAVSTDSAYQAVTSLRRQLGDDPRRPAYIATVPRLGYRMVAKVEWEDCVTDLSVATFPAEASFAPEDFSPGVALQSGSRVRSGLRWAAGGALTLALVVFFSLHGKILSPMHGSSPTVPPPQNSVAVLPFLDLTEGMKEEEFADGMTEELIDKISKIPGLRVPSPTSSFYYKDKRIPVADISQALGVVYVLDGSVRKSGSWLRVDARLIRGNSGYVIWSETYNQPATNILMVQDDIAAEVTKALKSSIATSSAP
jgi:transcriptional activator of cad operon